MHRHTRTKTQAVAVLLAAMLVMSGITVMPASAAASNYTPSFVEAPTYILNDHTPFGVRFEVAPGSGLPAGTYYVKIRIANTNSRSTWDTALHRGFTYDPVANHWEQERDDWYDCPTVTVKADGSIESGWVYAKLGDETVSGTRYIHVALSATGDSSTYNPTVVPQVTVLDTKTQGAWVHNGTEDETLLNRKRVALRSSDANTTGGADGSSATALLYSLWETQENSVDDDSNGLVDAVDPNENYGLQTSTIGDYRLSAPLSTLLDIYVNRSKLRNNDFTVGAQADCDIAVPTDAAEGTADITAPGAIADLTVTPTVTSMDLDWTGIADEVGGSGIGGYRVYRWETPTSVDPVPYTPVPVCIATVDGATTEYSDDTFEFNTEYAYQVRAVDVATNVGPRSNTVTGELVDTTAPTAPTVAAVPVSTGSIALSWTGSTDAGGSGVAYYEIRRGSTLIDVVNASVSQYTVTGLASGTAYTFSVTAGDAADNLSTAGEATASTLAPIYRFYNVTNGTHFYTDSASERDMVIAKWPAVFNYEGEAYYLNPTNNTQPLTRLYNHVSSSHFYTANPGEAANALAKWPNVFTLDGLTYTVNTTAVANSLPVYRFYNVRNGSHFYTASESEKNNVIAKWPDIYSYEGPAFWIGQ